MVTKTLCRNSLILTQFTYNFVENVVIPPKLLLIFSVLVELAKEVSLQHLAGNFRKKKNGLTEIYQ